MRTASRTRPLGSEVELDVVDLLRVDVAVASSDYLPGAVLPRTRTGHEHAGQVENMDTSVTVIWSMIALKTGYEDMHNSLKVNLLAVMVCSRLHTHRPIAGSSFSSPQSRPFTRARPKRDLDDWLVLELSSDVAPVRKRRWNLHHHSDELRVVTWLQGLRYHHPRCRASGFARHWAVIRDSDAVQERFRGVARGIGDAVLQEFGEQLTPLIDQLCGRMLGHIHARGAIYRHNHRPDRDRVVPLLRVAPQVPDSVDSYIHVVAQDDGLDPVLLLAIDPVRDSAQLPEYVHVLPSSGRQVPDPNRVHERGCVQGI
ncbi:uncharacterized protein FTJAE_5049 [Fusarium tjaetaba]|uniref:Uncharacterized protein n=1 Tax=Fusarium tjaetaba TaxID=1567544 RepID=A0A8H5RTT6_9HYPO|nr:uncharacterized protein FTJAE_5049 [Fusarium tjaetaba]KAF5638978.1 hypothetical protein FTJAE_5049 [Fusarium tjaetaba]